MAKKKKKKPTLEDKLKYEIADELGLTDKIKEVGWGGLTAKESGRIGGLMTVRKRDMKKKKNESE
ncbi:alpha/beta-type small acid-soluble spore protein [Schnuerera sp. xch1]|uniref:small, acid-soluble spore protein, alpha/beta type n=1 Tax=Schnuerera sp. xch1 TaxID=2874283 RepID=UPI001CBC23F2|nr:small, acid-soluble spore protein, alpha/beta type [Schnuerera sp. xch1]MBZ2175593.1 alpha/beta-type small acid-soluble spore protein [Schnuerera sp. xch1]